MKSDSRAGVRFFNRTSWTPPVFHRQRLLKAQRRRVIVIIVGLPAEQAVARLLVASDCPRVVLVDFQPDRSAPMPQRIVLGGSQKQRPDAAFADMGRDGDG